MKHCHILLVLTQFEQALNHRFRLNKDAKIYLVSMKRILSGVHGVMGSNEFPQRLVLIKPSSMLPVQA
jgi:hypothetical protein